MAWLKFRADGLFTGQEMLGPDAVLVTDTSGTVLDIIAADAAGDDVRTLEGTLCPGFVNAHCHLELSHMAGAIPPGTGLPGFLGRVVEGRAAAEGVVLEAMRDAVTRMHEEGISAVGDICNTPASIPFKREGPMHWVSFIEVLSATDAAAPARLQHFRELRDRFLAEPGHDGLPPTASLAAHAPYSTSPLSFRLVNEETAGGVTSLHNQETAAEDELYRYGTGDFLPFFRRLGYAQSPMPVTGRSSLRSVLPHYVRGQRLLLVHNTFTSADDMSFAAAHARDHGLEIVYCLCPNANLYIEGRLPPVAGIMAAGGRVVLGTDSLASNHDLSIAAEMRTLLAGVPGLGLATVLRWATREGARALGLQDRLGSFGRGMRPGVVWLDRNLHASRLC
jgi:cytosine/adenosine deaminase-related metal-dependent hydrolase